MNSNHLFPTKIYNFYNKLLVFSNYKKGVRVPPEYCTPRGTHWRTMRRTPWRMFLRKLPKGHLGRCPLGDTPEDFLKDTP